MSTAEGSRATMGRYHLKQHVRFHEYPASAYIPILLISYDHEEKK